MLFIKCELIDIRNNIVLYFRLFFAKQNELGDQASKLKNGLSKIDETRSKVNNMTEELEEARVKVIQYQKTCDEYLVNIVQQKRDADEQQKVIRLISTIQSLKGAIIHMICIF